jgi:ADP-heptose:LPS heptosyltransferase
VPYENFTKTVLLDLDFMERLVKEKIPPKAKILLIKLRSIGDVVYNTAVYAPLKKYFSDAHLTVLVERPSYDLVCDHPDVDEVLCFEKGSLWGQVCFYWRLMRQGYDVAIDMHEGTRGATMCFLSRAPLRIGHKFAKRAFLYTAGLEFSDLDPKFPLDYQVALIRKMGVAFDCVNPTIHISDSSRSRAKKILLGQGIDSGDEFCVIHPGTRKVYDQWQYDKFARLAEVFHAQYGLKVLLTCGPGEEPQAQDVLKLVCDTPVAFIQTGLQELGAITEKARFVLCHNGGYMHIASALGTPVVALFGVVNPRVWKPLGLRDVIIYKNLECSPCSHNNRKKECYEGDAECKRLIGVEDVLVGVEQILRS